MIVYFLLISLLSTSTIFASSTEQCFHYNIYNPFSYTFERIRNNAFYFPEKRRIELEFTQNRSFIRPRLWFYEEHAQRFFRILKEYSRLRSHAVKKHKRISRFLGTLKNVQAMLYTQGKHYWASSEEIVFRFFSQSRTRHQLILTFSEFVAYSNSFIRINPEQSYFDKDSVDELYKVFTSVM